MSVPNDTAAEKRTEQERALNRLRAELNANEGTDSVLYTLTDYGKGQTDYVRIFHVVDHSIEELTYLTARACGIRLTDRGLVFGGGNYSKALEAVDSLWRVAFNEPMPQGQWQKL